MRHDHRTREQRRADASARIAAVCLFLAALLIIVAALTVKTIGQPYKGEPPVIEDKLPGEDEPAEGCAVLDIGEPLGEFMLTADTYVQASECQPPVSQGKPPGEDTPGPRCAAGSSAK